MCSRYKSLMMLASTLGKEFMVIWSTVGPGKSMAVQRRLKNA